MSWKTVRFEELYATPSRNGLSVAKNQHDGDTKIVNMGELFANDFIGDIPMRRIRVEGKQLSNNELAVGDLLFARRSLIASGAGKASMIATITGPTVFESSIIRVRLNDTIAYPRFYAYWLRSPCGRDAISRLVTGTNVKGIRGSELKDIRVPMPPLDEQHRLASILMAYDNLIDNNRRQIALLEEAAQRLYKEWFIDLRFPGHEDVETVDGVPRGWNLVPIEELGSYLNGYAFKPSDHYSEGLPIIKIKELRGGITSDTPRNSGTDIPDKYLIRKGDIIFSWSATLAVDVWDGEDALLNQHLFKVTPVNLDLHEYTVQTLSNLIREMYAMTTGSTMTHLQRNKLKVIKTLVPSMSILNLYNNIALPIRRQITTLRRNVVTAREARDRLLPKLMSGEIQV